MSRVSSPFSRARWRRGSPARPTRRTVVSPSRSEPADAAREPAASAPVARVGFIGVGDMGGGIVTRIIAAGCPTVLWARRVEALDEFLGPDVERADTPAALAAA